MRLITIVKGEVGFKIGTMVTASGAREPMLEKATFFDFLTELVDGTSDFGKGGAKGARRQLKILGAINRAEEEGREMIALEDADYEAMKKTHVELSRNPAKARAMVEYFEAFESAQEEKGPAKG